MFRIYNNAPVWLFLSESNFMKFYCFTCSRSTIARQLAQLEVGGSGGGVSYMLQFEM